MKERSSQRKPWMEGIGIVLAIGLGLLLLLTRSGEAVTRFSYDLPFAFRSSVKPQEAVLIYLDGTSHIELKQPDFLPWDRGLHAQLLQRLKEEGAKAVVFDIVFLGEGADPKSDDQLADAMKKFGAVAICGEFETEDQPGTEQGLRFAFPYQAFRDAAADMGDATFRKDADFGIRELNPGNGQIPSLAYCVAKLVGAKPLPAPAENRWINYYGEADTLPNISYYLALQGGKTPPNFFRNKVVFVGARQSSGFTGEKKDEFATPYTRWSNKFAPGVEVQATAFLNLLRHDWLVRLPTWLEAILLVLCGAGSVFWLMKISPLRAAIVTSIALVILLIIAHVLPWYAHVWFGNAIFALVILFALSWVVTVNATRAYWDRRLLQHSLEFYVSPARVKEIIKRPELLKPGATQRTVSIMFSDIANFSKISERMVVDDLVALLNNYYENSIDCIYATDGMVLDLIGDAIFAIWNAPDDQADHQERACKSALSLHEKLIQFDSSQRSLPLRTRVGLHTGTVCVGNIGSSRRFDYTAIGEGVNLASRLEGLNKHVGTNILATRDIQRSVEGKLLTRLIGHFKFKGFDRVVEVHELMGKLVSPPPAYVQTFAEALHKYQRKEFTGAQELFQRALDQQPDDGPSKFYLQQVKEKIANPPAAEWTGEVDMREK